MQPRPLALAVAATLAAGGAARGQTIDVIYSKKWSSPTGSIPGTLDLTGNPVAGRWRAIEDFNVRPDGGEWIVKGRTDLGSDLETILVKGTAGSGTMFCQEGQPFQGAGAGQLYDFFDTPRPASWDTAGNIVFSARSKGAPTSDDEKMVRVVGGTHTILLQQGDPALGLTDIPANPTGDELFGNSMGGVYALDSGQAAFVNTPITNLSSFRYPATFRGNTMWRGSGVSMIGSETWDTFDLDTHGGTPDGLHWYAQGEFELAPDASDHMLAVDDVVVIREGSPVGASGLNAGAVLQASMAPNGTWYARGRDNSGTTAAAPDWAVRNGVVIAKTGDAVGADAWGDSFYAFTGNSAGDWAISGRTTNANPAVDDVLVYNGTVILREGDPIDLDGNGTFDDDTFVGRGVNTNAAFDAFDLFVDDAGVVWVILSLRTAAGVDVNDAGFGTPNAFVRIDTTPVISSLCFGDGTTATPCPCGNTGMPGRGCDNSIANGGALLTAAGSTNPDLVVLSTSNMLPTVSHVYLQGNQLLASGTIFGDGVRCAGGQLLRLAVKSAVGGASQFPDVGDPSITARSAALGDVIAPGTSRWYQTYYRDPDLVFCPNPPGNSWNVTNGIRVVWQ